MNRARGEPGGARFLGYTNRVLAYGWCLWFPYKSCQTWCLITLISWKRLDFVVPMETGHVANPEVPIRIHAGSWLSQLGLGFEFSVIFWVLDECSLQEMGGQLFWGRVTVPQMPFLDLMGQIAKFGLANFRLDGWVGACHEKVDKHDGPWFY